MSPLDAARLIQDGLSNDIHPCSVCLKEYPSEHHPDCAVLSMPKIVAALEAIERAVAQTYEDEKTHEPTGLLRSRVKDVERLMRE